MIDNIYNKGGGTPIKFDPQKLKYNSSGIPVLSAREIEEIANELLQKYCPEVLCKPSMTPVVAIIDCLGKRTGLSFAMEDLGYQGTAKILGKVSFHKKMLCLDVSLEGEREAAFRFTAAHEIGHWILHRFNYKNWKFPTNDSLQDDETTLWKLEEKTPQNWLETQANIFAASLIMPCEMFFVALKQIQRDMGIIKNIGRIYVSNNLSSRRDYETIVGHLAQIFHVSKKSVQIRTKTLRLIEGNFTNENEVFAINPFNILRSLKI